MRTTVKYLDRFLMLFSFLFSILFILSVCTQIFSRTFLPRTPSWTEEIARYTFIYSVAFAAGLAVRTKSFVAVDILTSRIAARFQWYYEIGLNILLLVFTTFVEVRCVYKFAFFKMRMVSTALEIPMQYIYFSMMLLFGMLAICYLLETIMMLQNRITRRNLA